MADSDTDSVKVGFPVPPTFSVVEYIRLVQTTDYKNSRDFDFDGLVSDLPIVLKKFTNDIVAKAILSHYYGEFLAKDFRNWVRGQLDETIQFEDGGAGIEDFYLEEST